MRGKEYVYPVQTKQMRENNEDPRVRVSEIIEGDKRLDGESYQEYKDRMKVETKLIRDYLKGYIIER
jgi:hypothetical protein